MKKYDIKFDGKDIMLLENGKILFVGYSLTDIFFGLIKLLNDRDRFNKKTRITYTWDNFGLGDGGRIWNGKKFLNTKEVCNLLNMYEERCNDNWK